MSDSDLLVAHRKLVSGLQTNCEAAAEGLFVVAANICAHRPQLAEELLAEAIRPLYYLGIEDLPSIKRFVEWIIRAEDLYLGLPTDNGRGYLTSLLGSDDTVVAAFRKMYETEDNQWRDEEADTPTVPRILR